MAIGFYSLEETKLRLGKNEQELRQLIRTGSLNVMEDGDALWFSAADVDEMSKPELIVLEEIPTPSVPQPKPSGPAKKKDITEEKIALEPEDEAPPANGTSKIRAFGQGGIASGKSAHDTSHLHRQVVESSAVATRCRTFHAKLNDASLSYMDNLINEWADANPDVGIKFATSCIGVVEGKHAEPHLIVTLFY